MRKKVLIGFIIVLIVAVFLISKGHDNQKERKVEDSNTLSFKVKQDKEATKENNSYYYEGEVFHNYIKIFNRLFRILSMEEEKIKMVSNNNEAVFFYGENYNYEQSNIFTWLNQTEEKHSGVYYDSIPKIENFLVPTEYCINQYQEDTITCLNERKDYFTILNIEDYLKAGDKQSYLNNGLSSYLLGYDETNTPLNQEEDGTITSSSEKASGIRVVMTLKKGITVKEGDGSIQNPYLIDQNGVENDIYKYVQLGEDTYQIYEEQEDLIKLKNTEYLEIKKNFSSHFSGFNPLNKNNIAYYLNTTYYDSLSYKEVLTECEYQTGALLDNRNYQNIYTTQISTKIGLPNIFDLNNSNLLTDYYLINTSKEDQNISYIYDKFGHIKEEETTAVNNIITTICISKNKIKKGTGTKKNPYITE